MSTTEQLSASITETVSDAMYRRGRQAVYKGILTTRKHVPRQWQRHDAIDCQRVIRQPSVTLFRRVR